MKTNKENMIIIIESEYESRGEEIARALSAAINTPCFGKEILDVAAELSGISVKLLHKYDGRSVYAAYDLSAEDESQIKLPPARDFITAQMFACRKLAQNAPCILVDRHAYAALAGNENLISVFVHSDFNFRAEMLAKERGISLERAAKELKKIDTAYRSYYRGNNKNWGNASNYSLCLNSTGCDVKDMAAMIVAFAEKTIGESLVTDDHKIAG